jgi:hypothetical protein
MTRKHLAMAAAALHTGEVVGSIPTAPTIRIPIRDNPLASLSKGSRRAAREASLQQLANRNFSSAAFLAQGLFEIEP